MPQLAGLAAYASQLQNLTRRLDLAVALTEAFSAAVYIPLPGPVLSSAVLPGLRLESKTCCFPCTLIVSASI